ncbi:RDD family protein [Silanimonas algicola]
MTALIPQARPASLGWRLLALVYDLFPVFALVLAFGGVVTAIAAALGHPDLSDLPWMAPVMVAGTWSAAGAYFVLSWSRGGQTLGMRPWRLKVVGDDGHPASRLVLLRRYALATVPAILGIEVAAWLPGIERLLPFWIGAGIAAAGPLWSLVDRDSAALYDRWAGTRFVRLEAP